jgi:hypothetical protein
MRPYQGVSTYRSKINLQPKIKKIRCAKQVNRSAAECYIFSSLTAQVPVQH